MDFSDKVFAEAEFSPQKKVVPRFYRPLLVLVQAWDFFILFI
jgi:hypothetical protein